MCSRQPAAMPSDAMTPARLPCAALLPMTNSMSGPRVRRFGGIAGDLDLPEERQHVGCEPRGEQHIGLELLRRGVLLRLVEPLEHVAQHANEDRNAGGMHRYGHVVSLYLSIGSNF